jgi:hypothetical protein
MENHHFSWENPLLMAIFNSYVKLPEGKLSFTSHQSLFPAVGSLWGVILVTSLKP